MKLKALMPVAVLALSATACGYSIQTATDYDRTVNFGGYHTFFVMKGNSSGNALLDQRATEDVRRALTSKGWAEVPAGNTRPLTSTMVFAIQLHVRNAHGQTPASVSASSQSC